MRSSLTTRDQHTYALDPQILIVGKCFAHPAGTKRGDTPATVLRRSAIDVDRGIASVADGRSICPDVVIGVQESRYTFSSRLLVMKYILVPLMLAAAGLLMSLAWIGHLKYKDDWSFLQALLMSWLFVLPEYILNVFSARWGVEVYTGAQMAAMHLAAGVVAVALVSRFFLHEPLSWTQIGGFALMIVSIAMIVRG